MGKIFSNDREYKSTYYSNKPSQKQIEALQQWNQLQKEVGRKVAIGKKRSERELKKGTIRRYQSSGVATHDAVSAVMDLVAEGSNRDELRDDPNLMYAMVKHSEKLVGESEAKKMGLLTYDQLNELLAQWESEIDSAAAETPF